MTVKQIAAMNIMATMKASQDSVDGNILAHPHPLPNKCRIEHIGKARIMNTIEEAILEFVPNSLYFMAPHVYPTEVIMEATYRLPATLLPTSLHFLVRSLKKLRGQ